MFKWAFPKARRPSSRNRRPRAVAALLPEPLERRVLMASTVTITAGGQASEFGNNLTYVIERTSPIPPGTDYAFITLGGAAHENGPGDDYDFVSGVTWDAAAGMYRVTLGTPAVSVVIDPLTDSNYEEGTESLVLTLDSVTGSHVIGSAGSATGEILDSTTLQLTEAVPHAAGDGNADGDSPSHEPGRDRRREQPVTPPVRRLAAELIDLRRQRTIAQRLAPQPGRHTSDRHPRPPVGWRLQQHHHSDRRPLVALVY